MRRQFTIALLLAILNCSAILAQEAAKEPYEDDEAYHVYSVLLPQEESYGIAKGTLVIQEDTVPSDGPTTPCLTPEATSKFKDAIADFRRVNSKQWRLQRHFDSEKPYEIESAETIKVGFQEGGWVGFYKRHPGSGGYIVMSAVGFNKSKILAIVYSGSSCGGLCGQWSYHLLEKLDGKWKEAPGVTCNMVS